jgi:hypothetical protein
MLYRGIVPQHVLQYCPAMLYRSTAVRLTWLATSTTLCTASASMALQQQDR